MKTLIVCESVYHGNTRKIADAMAKVLGAEVRTPQEAGSLEGYDLVGFGSGIAYWKHYKGLFGLVEALPEVNGKKAFIFSTSGFGTTGYHAPMRKKLMKKGFEIAGEFACKAFDTSLLFSAIGGINKGHPDDKDLERARKFAEQMLSASESGA